jgi:hypothetical protein
MAATCPLGSEPGTLVQLQSPSGGLYQVPVPDGIAPGQTFYVQLPAPPMPAPTTVYGSLPAQLGEGGGTAATGRTASMSMPAH